MKIRKILRTVSKTLTAAVLCSALLTSTVFADQISENEIVADNVAVDTIGEESDGAIISGNDIEVPTEVPSELPTEIPSELPADESLSADVIPSDMVFAGDVSDGELVSVESADEAQLVAYGGPDGVEYYRLAEGDVSIETVYLGWGTSSMFKKANAEAKRLVEELTTPEMTDMQKIFVLAKYICEEITYGGIDDTYKGQTAYEALIGKRAVCAGKTQAFDMMLYYAGINNVMITSQLGNHAWTQVELDGIWFELDSTNCRYVDGFLMSSSINNYHKSDSKLYEDNFNGKFLYDRKMHSCTNTTFNNVNFVKYSSGYHMDWPTFVSATSARGIKYQNYVSTCVGGISAEYIGEMPAYEHQKILPANVEVHLLTKSGTPSSSPTYTPGGRVSTSAYKLSKTIFDAGLNEITVTCTSGIRTFTKTIYVSALPDAVSKQTLTAISAAYVGGDEFVGRGISKAKIIVTPTFKYDYYSGYTETKQAAPVDGFTVSGYVNKGKNTFTVDYTYGGITKSARIYVVGIYPDLRSVRIRSASQAFANGTDNILIDSLSCAYLDLSDGTSILTDVVWNDYQKEYDPDKADKQVITAVGNAVLPATVTNLNKLPLTVKKTITVNAASSQLSLVSATSAGTYKNRIQVQLSGSNSSQPYYSINGNDYIKYTGPIILKGVAGEKTTYNISFYFHKRGYRDSVVTNRNYVVDLTANEDTKINEIPDRLVLIKGEKKTITVPIAGCTYVSDDPTVVSVTKKGAMSARKAGNANVCVYNGEKLIEKYAVQVQAPYFSPSVVYLLKGDDQALVLQGTTEDVEYSVPPRAAATASVFGNIVSGYKAGKVKATAKVHGRSFPVTVVVEQPLFKKSIVTLQNGKTLVNKLAGTKRPADSWASSNTSVATVDATGRVTALSCGKTEISAVMSETCAGKTYTHTYKYTLIVK